MKETKMAEKGIARVSRDLQVADRNPAFVKVSRADVDQLVTEIMQVKEFLPKVLNADLLGVYSKLDHCEQELEISEAENKKLRRDLEQMKTQYDSDMAVLKKRNDNLLEDCERHREEKYGLKCQLSELSQQIGDQSEYCSSMGAAVCTLLWRVSRQQDSVTSMLGGNKAEEFLHITARTLESYFDSYGEEDEKETSEEFQFVLALTGTITNMAAAAQGRDFLVTKDNGRVLIDTFITVLGVSAVGKNVKMRNLILMALYNVSINLSGLQYIIKKQGMLGNLMQVIRGCHHICVTWNGESGVVMQYLDGVRKQAETGLVWEYEGGGTLKMGGSTSFPYDLSSFNLWDKAVAPENIKDLSKSCLRGIGNAKSWLDFKGAARAKRTLQVVSPSVCTSPSQPSTNEPTEEPLFSYSSPWNNDTHPVGPAGIRVVDEPEYHTLSNPPSWEKGTNNGELAF